MTASAPRPRSPKLPAWCLGAAVDGALLGMFMISAALFGTLLEHPDSPVHRAMADADWRRFCMGLAMGTTAVALIYSPFGKFSGAHLNPATTLTFWRLGRLEHAQALGYVAAQFVGGALGLWLAAWCLEPWLAAMAVHYVVTSPGQWGQLVAFATELALAFTLMSVVLRVSQSRRWNRLTGVVAGILVCSFITFAAPLSGMSINPARTFASAVVAGDFTGLWLYFAAPPLGMLLAAQWFVRTGRRAHCAKLHHANERACPFRCGWDAA